MILIIKPVCWFEVRFQRPGSFWMNKERKEVSLNWEMRFLDFSDVKWKWGCFKGSAHAWEYPLKQGSSCHLSSPHITWLPLCSVTLPSTAWSLLPRLSQAPSPLSFHSLPSFYVQYYCPSSGTNPALHPPPPPHTSNILQVLSPRKPSVPPSVITLPWSHTVLPSGNHSLLCWQHLNVLESRTPPTLSHGVQGTLTQPELWGWAMAQDCLGIPPPTTTPPTPPAPRDGFRDRHRTQVILVGLSSETSVAAAGMLFFLLLLLLLTKASRSISDVTLNLNKVSLEENRAEK